MRKTTAAGWTGPGGWRCAGDRKKRVHQQEHLEQWGRREHVEIEIEHMGTKQLEHTEMKHIRPSRRRRQRLDR